MGCDVVWSCKTLQNYNFYSHIPCGMWLTSRTKCRPSWQISTHTSRVGCDFKRICHYVFYCISTHTSRVGCDALPRPLRCAETYFYSHIPCGMWQTFYTRIICISNFYSHIPCGMWRAAFSQLLRRFAFLLTHPVWDVTWSLLPAFLHRCKFLLTHPVWDVTQGGSGIVLR